MRHLLRIFVIETFVLYLASITANGLIFENGLGTVLFAGFGMASAALVVKPIINLLLLPINLITFNLFKWVSSAVTLYIVTLVIPGFVVDGFEFPGLASDFLDLPQIMFTGVLSYVAFSFLIALYGGFIYWLVNQK